MKYKNQQIIDEFREKFIVGINGKFILTQEQTGDIEQFLDEQLSKKEEEVRGEIETEWNRMSGNVLANMTNFYKRIKTQTKK